jgi:hypothetical protein
MWFASIDEFVPFVDRVCLMTNGEMAQFLFSALANSYSRSTWTAHGMTPLSRCACMPAPALLHNTVLARMRARAL